MTTIELTRELIKARKLQDCDKVLARILNMWLVNSLGRQEAGATRPVGTGRQAEGCDCVATGNANLSAQGFGSGE
jgi:hypothetical protein